MGKVIGLARLVGIRKLLRKQRRVVVFTNGTFDIIHRGHVEYLSKAKSMGDILIVGLNTDASIRRIKGKGRPLNPKADRAAVLAALAPVDYVCFFGQDTPRTIISKLVPDVLVKGADWDINAVVGKDIVERNGGSVRTIRLTPGRSTSKLIRRIVRVYGDRQATVRRSND